MILRSLCGKMGKIHITIGDNSNLSWLTLNSEMVNWGKRDQATKWLNTTNTNKNFSLNV